MRGFLGCNGNSVFDNALHALTEAIGEDSLTLFGSQDAQSPPEFTQVPYGRALRCDTAFSRHYNPDAVLFDSVVADTSSLSLYVTDGVQSVPGSRNLAAATEQLKRWLIGGGSIAIVPLRAAYHDSVWSEQAGHFIPGREGLERPYYIFALARTEPVLDYWMRQISRALGVDTVARFTPLQRACAFKPTVTRVEGACLIRLE